MNNLISSPDAIAASLDRLRSLSQVTIQTGWHCCDRNLSLAEVMSEDWHQWAIAEQNAKSHLPWAKGQVYWLVQTVSVPHDLQGYCLQGHCLRLALTWWAVEAQIFVDGQLVQEGDLFDCSTRLLLSTHVNPGDTFTIALRLVSPSHDDGALVRSVCLYETISGDLPEPSFIADELEVLHLYLNEFAPDQISLLADAIAQLDWSPLPCPAFTQSLKQLRDRLLPLSPLVKQRAIKLLGHAHLDMAWLWTVAETWKAAERTFESVLKLQDEFPELIFCHSTPALYEWMEQNRPELFRRIQKKVKEGRWEPIGGIWVEPELNMISAESIARQILYGQQYYQDKFGKTSAIAWLPDSFGFTWQLPQLLKQGGIDYFVTQKLRWNDTTQFPYELFQWQAADGTQILSLMSAPIGEGIDPVKIATYACNWEQKTGIPISLWLPGVGDHGGGPTRDMLELARRWGRSPFFPKLEFTTAERYLRDLAADQRTTEAQSNPQVSKASSQSPVWNSELYLEFHRGCYTTHADQKAWNRRCEGLLYEAELFASLATLAVQSPYPELELEQAWKLVLFNQFHDILPGSSISQVFTDAEPEWQQAEQIGLDILERSLDTLCQHIALPAPPHPAAQPIVVFNPSNWARSQVLELPFPETAKVVAVSTDAGDVVPFEQSAMGSWIFYAKQIPAIGYRVFWVQLQAELPPSQPVLDTTDFVLENLYLRVEVDPATGELAGIFDKVQQWDVLSDRGNQLQVFADQGQYWDAWNIDPDYAQKPLAAPELQNIQWLERGALRSRLAVVRTLGQSTFYQEYVLEQGAVLTIETRVDWQERHLLVKAAFPLNLTTNFATYEIPCGAIQRPTQAKTDAEKAQWEVPALQWADLSDRQRGVSLLNDCKHGYDCQPGQIRLTLLRGAEWPDPEADLGWHSFTYALVAHAHPWQINTVRLGHELNHPMGVKLMKPIPTGAIAPSLPTTAELLYLGGESLVLMALKQSKTAPMQWVLRCYECQGEPTQLELRSDLNLSLPQSIDILERPSQKICSHDNSTIQPWQIASFAIAPSAKPPH